MKNTRLEGLPIDFKQIADMDFSQYCYFQHLKSRELILNQDIDEVILEKFTLQIVEWNKEDVSKSMESRKPIKIFINSCGGTIADGMALIDVILSSKTPIYTIVHGYAYSMGCLIAIAGRRRFAYTSSTLLLHDGSAGCVTSGSKFADVSKFYRETEERTKQYILARTEMSEGLYDEKYGNEFYMYSDKAKELGFIDEIIGDDITLDEFLKL
jgi:ATP-dependent Clp protease, protease subunit